MNKKFIVVDLPNLDDLTQNWNDKGLEDYYAVIFKTHQKINVSKIEKFGEKFGNFLDYGNKNYVIYNLIHNENPLHFDGVSTLDKSRIPDRLFFFVNNIPLTSEGKFKILNCESILYDLSEDVLKFLNNVELEYYGYPSINFPNPKPFELVFSHKAIWEYDKKKILRMQLPSQNSKYMEIEKDFVLCKSTNYRTRFKGYSGVETANIFKSIHESIKTKNHLIEISFEEGDFLVTKNKFTFHGRYGTEKPLQRQMYRFQIIDYN